MGDSLFVIRHSPDIPAQIKKRIVQTMKEAIEQNVSSCPQQRLALLMTALPTPELTASEVGRSLAATVQSTCPASATTLRLTALDNDGDFQMRTLTLLAAAIAVTLGAAYASLFL